MAAKKKAKKKTAKKKTAKKTDKTAADRKNGQDVTDSNPQAAGQPPKIVDWDIVEKLCGIHCTGEEIASFIGIDYDTLNARCKEEHEVGMGDYIADKKKIGNVSLRRKQWMLANAGNPTMLIWLGKQVLGQKEKNDFSSEDGSMSLDGLTAGQRKALDKINDDEY